MNNLFCISPKALCTTLTLLFLPLIIIYQGHGLCEPSCSSQSYRSILSTNHKATLYTQKSPVYIDGFSHLPLHFEIIYPSTFLGCSLLMLVTGVIGLLLNLLCSISPYRTVLIFLGHSCTSSYLLLEGSHIRPKLWRHAH